jgi:predicted nucleotidyltransferase
LLALLGEDTVEVFNSLFRMEAMEVDVELSRRVEIGRCDMFITVFVQTTGGLTVSLTHGLIFRLAS